MTVEAYAYSTRRYMSLRYLHQARKIEMHVFSEERRHRSAFSAQQPSGVRPGRRPAAPPERVNELSAGRRIREVRDACDAGCLPSALAMADWMSTKTDRPSPTTTTAQNHTNTQRSYYYRWH